MDQSIFNQVFKLMQKSFPKNEYRNYENQRKLLQNPHYNISPYFNDKNELIAFIAVWDFSSFKFVEHIAVSEACRGMGIGTKIMEDLLKSSRSDVILEIEPPKDEVTIKRLHFYERLGFRLNEFPYFQLPLNRGDKKIPLCILSYPQKITEQKFENIKNTIYSNVYSENND